MQFGVNQVHLPEIGLGCIDDDPRPVLHSGSEVHIANYTQSGGKHNLPNRGLAEGMRRIRVNGGYLGRVHDFGLAGSVRVRMDNAGMDYYDVSDARFRIRVPVPGDLNCDRVVDALDIEPFIVALFEPEAYSDLYPDCNILRADLNGDGFIDALDIEPFIALLFP